MQRAVCSTSLMRLAGLRQCRAGLPVALATTMRFQSGDAAAPVEDGAATRRRTFRGMSALSQARRSGNLPPAVDFVHWNDDDLTRGYLLRVLHKENFILLDYHRQAQKTSEPGNKADRIVTVTIPAVYVARLLGVLEGKMDKVEIQSRFTHIVFQPKSGAANHFTLTGTSTWQRGGGTPAAEGGDVVAADGVEEQTLQWDITFDTPEALMLQRFLSQSLHYNKGFGRVVN